ncbi:MAG: lysoplasmalogenase [Myxococcaceae bacterium]|nr:lysoplasmalogenase [Myxococcaceae bacterium]MCI0670493.1 lysoplasmalogenase [Myxococcaceae bacterium]
MPSAFRRSDMLFLASALVYIALLPLWPYPGAPALKVVPLLVLWVDLFLRPPMPGRGVVLTALAFGALGDVALDFEGPTAFMAGLGAFLVGHLFYIAAFTRLARKGTLRWGRAAAVVAAGVALGAYLVPRTGGLALPVAGYVLAITAMATTAVLAARTSPLLVIGALSFLASDTTIAMRKFVVPLPWAGYFVMVTYYLAQYGLVRGWAREVESADESLPADATLAR